MHNRNRVGDGSWGSILEVGDRFFFSWASIPGRSYESAFSLMIWYSRVKPESISKNVLKSMPN
jgi:hypothetical protein